MADSLCCSKSASVYSGHYFKVLVSTLVNVQRISICFDHTAKLLSLTINIKNPKVCPYPLPQREVEALNTLKWNSAASQIYFLNHYVTQKTKRIEAVSGR